MTPRAELARIRERQRVLGEVLAGDPAWEILLDLADAGTLKTGSAGASTRVPATTALRYVGILERAGLVKRSPKDGDGRVMLVALTDQGREAVERCLK